MQSLDCNSAAFFEANRPLVSQIFTEIHDYVNESHHLHRIFSLHEDDEEFSGIRSNYDYERYSTSLQASILDIRASFIFQFSKQYLSMKYGSAFRDQGEIQTRTGLRIATVIVAARNQALHFEEGCPKNRNDKVVWKKLNEAHGEIFIFPANRSYAKDVLIKVLEWEDFERFEGGILAI